MRINIGVNMNLTLKRRHCLFLRSSLGSIHGLWLAVNNLTTSVIHIHEVNHMITSQHLQNVSTQAPDFLYKLTYHVHSMKSYLMQEVLKCTHKSPFVFEGYLCGKAVVQILLSMWF